MWNTLDFLIAPDAGRRPVLVAGIKDDSWTGNASLRLGVGQQLRRRYDLMVDTCPLSRLGPEA